MTESRLVRNRTLAALLLLLPLLVALGCTSPEGSAREGNPAAGPDAVADAVPGPSSLDAARSFRSVREPRQAAPPASISIPKIDVKGPLTRTGFNPDRTLAVPEFGSMSWFRRGVAPGDPGPAAILGHVDSRRGPDVFFRLRELSAGDTIVVTDREGTRRRFVVDRVEQHAKDKFPTDEVWLPTPDPQLRLITCGGVFDREARSYRDNVIVFASLDR